VPGGSRATGSGAEGSAGLVISRRAVLLGAGAACVHAVLFVGAAIGRISIVDVLRTIWPCYLAILGVLLVVAHVPALCLWLPGVLRSAG
jgi:TRAP-type C4-dicarboxylate transport system permease large subunit